MRDSRRLTLRLGAVLAIATSATTYAGNRANTPAPPRSTPHAAECAPPLRCERPMATSSCRPPLRCDHHPATGTSEVGASSEQRAKRGT